MSVTVLNPYSMAFKYRDQVWKGVLPLPYKQKEKPPLHWTGNLAGYPSLEQISEWLADGQQNICLRLAGVDKEHELFGIDVDHYIKGGKPKTGGDQLAELEARLGPLPDTWISTARTDGVSGIRYFRVPRGLAFRGKADKDIDCISKGYRYAMVWPSFHPDVKDIVWWFPPGTPLTEEGRKVWENDYGGEIPNAQELPELPPNWLKYLATRKLDGSELMMDRQSSKDEVYHWAETAFHGYHDDMCPRMREKVDGHKKKIEEESASFTFLVPAHQNIIHLASEGHLGCDQALKEVSECYTRVCIDRDKRDNVEKIDGEIFRSIIGALRKKKGSGKPILVSCDKPGGLCYVDIGQQGTINITDPHTFSNDKRGGQLRLAHMFADNHEGKFIHIHGIGWHYWSGTHWAYDDCGKSYRAAIKTLDLAWQAARRLPADDKKRLLSAVNACQSNNGITGLLAVASKLRPFALTVRDLDQDPYLLNCANGTLDLRTMDLHPHNPDDKITRICRGAYLPGMISDAWEAFLYTVLPDESVRFYLQRLAGLSLVGKVKEHLLPILTGTGRNGKGTWYEAMLYAMGDYGGIAEPDLLMHREGTHPTGQMALRGKRLVVISESDKNRRLAEATTRRLVGGDPITARFMRQDFVTFDPSHLAMLITNHLPRVNGDDPATWARLRVIPFDVVIPPEDRDTNLGEKLQAEADAVLTWAVVGWQDYYAVGTAEPQAVLEATDTYHNDSDDVQTFIDEECVTGEAALKHESTTRELHKAWLLWQTRNDCPPMGQKEFARTLEKKGYPMVGREHRRHGLGLRSSVGVIDISTWR